MNLSGIFLALAVVLFFVAALGWRSGQVQAVGLLCLALAFLVTTPGFPR